MSSTRARKWWTEGIVVGLLIVVATAAAAEDKQLQSAGGNEEPPANAERLAWWRDARFGMFIHWGPVSLKGTEIGWSRGADVPLEEYDNLYKQFNPEKFDSRAWVMLAKQAGMKYLIFTTKHHDGFCMFDTKETDFNIMRSPFGTRHRERVGRSMSPRRNCLWHLPFCVRLAPSRFSPWQPRRPVTQATSELGRLRAVSPPASARIDYAVWAAVDPLVRCGARL